MKLGNIILLTVLIISPLVKANTAGSDSLLELSKPEEEKTKTVKVKYKESGRIDFESLLIEGERKKPELSVVTGNVGEKDSGLMVFRLDFIDTMSNDFGEVVP